MADDAGAVQAVGVTNLTTEQGAEFARWLDSLAGHVRSCVSMHESRPLVSTGFDGGYVFVQEAGDVAEVWYRRHVGGPIQ